MRKLRVFLLLLLCIAIPLQGFAHMSVAETTYAMEHAAAEFMADAATPHDCCDNADTPAKTTGKACGQCGSPCPVFQVRTHSPAPVHAVRFPRFRLIELFVHSFYPSSVWRPPALF